MTTTEARQRHQGSLHISPGSQGLRATIDISELKVVIAIDHGDAFVYSRDQVEGRIFDSRTVLLDITGDEDLYFVADDPFLFTAKAVPALRAVGAPRSTESGTTEQISRRLPVIGATIAPAQVSKPTAPPRSGRKRRDRGRTECDHQWRSLSIAGGLVRRVCNVCRVVSIDLTE